MVLDLFQRIFNKGYEPSTEGYELRPIVVSAEYRGRDVAPLLLKVLMRDARERGFSTIHLYTEENNIPALRFYQKSGFQTIGKTDQLSNNLIILRIDIRE